MCYYFRSLHRSLTLEISVGQLRFRRPSSSVFSFVRCLVHSLVRYQNNSGCNRRGQSAAAKGNNNKNNNGHSQAQKQSRASQWVSNMSINSLNFSNFSLNAKPFSLISRFRFISSFLMTPPHWLTPANIRPTFGQCSANVRPIRRPTNLAK